jgi:hypothetical protein
MSENKEQPDEEAALPPAAEEFDGQAPNPDSQRIHDFIAELKRRLPETRLPAEFREQILANLPPPEVQERLYREMQENGGLSSEEFFASLGLEAEPQP